MNYIMKSGTLYANETMAARLKGVFTGPEKRIFSANGIPVMHTDIRSRETGKPGGVCSKQYVLSDEGGTECALGQPGYAKDDDPAVTGWPVCRVPKVDHAQLFIHGNQYTLTMQNSQNYAMTDESGTLVMQILHRGLAGGWNIKAADHFTPEIICGIFIFCKYIELENEFIVV